MNGVSSYILYHILKPHFNFRTIIDFEIKLRTWSQKSNPSKNNGPEGKQCKLKKKQPEAQKNNEDQEEGPCLKSILKKERACILQYTELGDTHRKLLVQTVVDYFFNNGIPFTQALRDKMAQQIKELFIHEDKVRSSLFTIALI